uniref:Uncharacterized protein n=1 Tax=Knipowitschia caucasica TaxID=637954 RepID=A0AAV2KVI9_KNICA
MGGGVGFGGGMNDRVGLRDDGGWSWEGGKGWCEGDGGGGGEFKMEFGGELGFVRGVFGFLWLVRGEWVIYMEIGGKFWGFIKGWRVECGCWVDDMGMGGGGRGWIGNGSMGYGGGG